MSIHVSTIAEVSEYFQPEDIYNVKLAKIDNSVMIIGNNNIIYFDGFWLDLLEYFDPEGLLN